MINQENSKIDKSDIANYLIESLDLRSYLEYNKFNGESYFHKIICEEKTLVYMLECSNSQEYVITCSSDTGCNAEVSSVMSLDQLIKRYEDNKFDVIFFDPDHIRPSVDECLQRLPSLLNPNGFLLVHDCNPESEILTSKKRYPGAWMGETYKAFALFHYHNRAQSLVVSEDYGVGVIQKKDLKLDYDFNVDMNFDDFANNRHAYIDLVDYGSFVAHMSTKKEGTLINDSNATASTYLLLAPSVGRSFVPEIKDSRAQSQLFWRAGNQKFSEMNSVTAEFCLDGLRQTIRFMMPAHFDSASDFRFDFANCESTICLESIELFLNSGEKIWESRVENNEAEFFYNPRNLRWRLLNGVLLISSSNNDPNFSLSFPDEVLAQISRGAEFVVKFTPQTESQHQIWGVVLSMLDCEASPLT